MKRLLALVAVLAIAVPVSAATVDGLRIQSAVAGAGPQTVILVHGWTCDSSSWDAQVPVLATKYRVITIDLPGHGKSDSPKDGKFSMDLFARAVEAVRAEADADRAVDQVILVGHSMGAPVIRQYARRFPAHVAGLVAVDGPLDMRGFGAGFTPPPMTGPEGLKAREGMIRGMFTPQTPQPVQKHVLAMMLAAPEATAAGAMRSILDPSLSTEDVTPMPALAIVAGTGQLPNVAETRKVLPAFEATQVAGTGHFVMMEKPEEFNRLLMAFLDRVNAPAARVGFAQAPAPGPGGGRGGFAPVVIGPPAPVPPEVAIPRPTPAELEQVNAELKRLVDNDKSSVQPLLKRFEPLMLLQPPRRNVAATFTQTNQRMGPRHEGFVATAKQGNIDLLLHGDSITDWWLQEANKPVFDKYFGNIRTANFAVAGDTTQGVLWGLRNGEGQGFQPKAVMLMIGTNNTGASTAPEIAEGIGAVVMELRRDFPDAKILLLAIFPRSVPADPVRDKIAEVNGIVAKLDDQKHVFYLDIGRKFLDDKGVFLPDSFRADNLHPQAKGYDIWGEAVSAKLAELMK
jgi:pimeloyl-ACP methyl ester carboxylesterase/lysophospholipase L1-like esterase